MADDFGPFNAMMDAALSPTVPSTVPGRPSIGIVPAASTPAPSAADSSPPPPASGGKSRTNYIIAMRHEIEDLRAAGAYIDADTMEATLTDYIRSSVRGPGAPHAGSTALDARGRSSPPPAPRAVPDKQDFHQMRQSFMKLVTEDPDIKALHKKIQPEPSHHSALIAAVELLMSRLRAVRPYGEGMANLITRVVLNLDSIPSIAADACVAYDEVTSWRQAGERIDRYMGDAPYRSGDGHSDSFKRHVSSLRAAYGKNILTESGSSPETALDRLLSETVQGFLANSWASVTPPVASAPHFVALLTQLQGSMRFGDDQLYVYLCRQLEEPVRVPVLAATTTPVHKYFQVAKAIHEQSMAQHALLNTGVAVRLLNLILSEVPQGTDPYLDNALQMAVQQLRQAVRKSDGSPSEVRALLCQHVDKHSGLEYGGDLKYKKAGKSSSGAAAFVARAEQGGGGKGQGSGAGRNVCRAWSAHGRCRYGDKCQFKHAQQEQPDGSRPDPSTIPCSHFLLHGKCTPRGGGTCPFQHSQAGQPAAPAKAEPALVTDAESSSRGRTDRRTGKTTRPNSPFRAKCPDGSRCPGIADASCDLWHPLIRNSPSASPSPSREPSAPTASELVRNAGFGPTHFKGFVEIMPQIAPFSAELSAQAHLAAGNQVIVKEAADRRSLRFGRDFEEVGDDEGPGLLKYSPTVAKYRPPSSSVLRRSRQEFSVHPELPTNLLSRKDAQRLHAEFQCRNVTSEWLRCTGQQRRDSVLQGMNWPEQLNRFIASCLYYGLPLTAPMRAAWDQLVRQGSICRPTRLNTWFGEPPDESDLQLPQGRVVDLTAIQSAVKDAEQGVYFIQNPLTTIFDSGCSPTALANSQVSGLRNIKQLPPNERFRVKGITGGLEIWKAGELHFRVSSKTYHADSVLREKLASLQVQLSREGPLFYYFYIKCFIDDNLPVGVTLVSLGQTVWNHRWRIQLDPEPSECYGLSDEDSATAVRLQFPLSIGDFSTGSSNTPNALLTMPGLELVPEGIDEVAAARETWARVRALYFTATENIAANPCGGLNEELVAYSLIGGYSGFYVAQELSNSASTKLPSSPAYTNSFRALKADAPDFDEAEQQDAEPASQAGPVEPKFRFTKPLLNQLMKSAKKAQQRRRQSAEFLRLDSRVVISPEPVPHEEVDQAPGDLSSSSSSDEPFSGSQCTALSPVNSLHYLHALPVCHCCRLSLEACGMSSANGLGTPVTVKEAQAFNEEAPSHSIYRSLSALVAQQRVKLREFEEVTGLALRGGTAVLLKNLPW